MLHSSPSHSRDRGWKVCTEICCMKFDVNLILILWKIWITLGSVYNHTCLVRHDVTSFLTCRWKACVDVICQIKQENLLFQMIPVISFTINYHECKSNQIRHDILISYPNIFLPFKSFFLFLFFLFQWWHWFHPCS